MGRPLEATHSSEQNPYIYSRGTPGESGVSLSPSLPFGTHVWGRRGLRVAFVASRDAEVRMLRIIEGLPGNVVGVEAVGQVRSTDYDEVLGPAVHGATEAHGKIRFLYVLGEEFEGYSGGAMWEDTKLGVTNWSNFERIALVTDNDRYEDLVKAFGWLLPGKVRTFDLDELHDAKAWITEAADD